MATRTISDAGGDWNVTGTWVEGVVPINGDAVVATATSGNLTITAAVACTSINLTSYVGTFTINSGRTLTVTGNVTIPVGMTAAGTGAIRSNTTCTISLAIAVPWTLTNDSSSLSWTIAQNITVGGLNFSGTATLILLGSRIISITGSLTCTKAVTSTGSTIRLIGTGTWSGSTSTGRGFSGPVEIDTAGTITWGGTGPAVRGTVTYISGTIISGSSFINLMGATSLLGTWPILYGVNTLASLTLTLNNPLTVTNFTPSNTLTMAGAQTINVTNLTFQASTGTITRDAGVWNITNLIVRSSFVGTLAGAFDQTVDNLLIERNGTFSFQINKTLTVNTSFILDGRWDLITTLKSSVASTAFTLALGSIIGESYVGTYTDVAVTLSGGATELWNYFGGTLLRTSNIQNFSTNPTDYSDPGVANVKLGTSYEFPLLTGTDWAPQTALNGTFQGIGVSAG